jgi:hypothetical protein
VDDEESGLEVELLDGEEMESTADMGASKDASLLQIAQRATASSIPVEWRSYEWVRDTPDGIDKEAEWVLFVLLPSGGKDRRRFEIPSGNAGEWLATNFESWVFLKDYAAIFDHSKNVVEALIVTTYFPFRTIVRKLQRQAKNKSMTEFLRTAPSDDTLKIACEGNTTVTDAEISRTSPGLAMTEGVRSSISLKLTLNTPLTYEATVSLLERFSAALFFEMDMLYGAPLSLREGRPQRVRSSRRDRIPDNIRVPMSPKNSYPAEATSLYAYGRSATDMPLLQYLAFYQVLE